MLGTIEAIVHEAIESDPPPPKVEKFSFTPGLGAPVVPAALASALGAIIAADPPRPTPGWEQCTLKTGRRVLRLEVAYRSRAFFEAAGWIEPDPEVRALEELAREKRRLAEELEALARKRREEMEELEARVRERRTLAWEHEKRRDP